MNYCYVPIRPGNGFPGVPGAGLVFSDWGPEDIYDLNENYLIEADGVKAKPGAGIDGPLGVTYRCETRGTDEEHFVYTLGEPIDWNRDGKINPKPVSYDVNEFDAYQQRGRTTLKPFNDIEVMKLDVGNIGESSTSYTVPPQERHSVR